MFNHMEKGMTQENKEGKQEILQSYEISGKLFDSFKSRPEVQKWIQNKEVGLVTQEFVATMKKTLDTTAMMEGETKAKEVARYIKDDLEFNNQMLNNDEDHETVFKVEADKYLNETYLRPEEAEGAAPSPQEGGSK